MLEQIPRVSLVFKPIPLEELTNQSKQLEDPRIFAKRDDLTGLALAKKADTVIMALDVLSDSARQTTAAVVKLGMKSILVLEGVKPDHITGNLLIDYLLGAEIHFAKTKEDQGITINQLMLDLTEKGYRPYVLSGSPMFTLSAALAYAEATLELIGQIESQSIDPESVHIYLSSSGKGQP